MYSVLRITGSYINMEHIKNIGESMNKILDNTYTGIRKAGDGFSIEISKSDIWNDHVNSVIEKIKLFEKVLIDGRESGINVTFDLAIENTDFHSNSVGLFLHESGELISCLNYSKIEMEISIYNNH